MQNHFAIAMNLIREIAAIETRAMSLKRVNNKKFLKEYREVGKKCQDFLIQCQDPHNVPFRDILRKLQDLKCDTKDSLWLIDECQKHLLKAEQEEEE